MRGKHKKNRQPVPKATWTPEPANPMFVSCSNCNFRVETIRAVETGWSSSEHVGLKYNFCPSCGRPMALFDKTASEP